MINLLPPENKKETLQEENWKIVMILGINLLLILVCFSLILYAINVFLSGEVDYKNIIYDQRGEEFNLPKMQEIESRSKLFNLTFFRLNNFYLNRFEMSSALNEIAEIIPPEIYLTNLSVSLDSSKAAKINITGFSPTRENLLLFERILKEKSNLKEINFSQASWVKQTDITFTVSLIMSGR